MSESGRRPLRPLSPQLPEPVRVFTEQLREIYWERTELNQRELASALHLTKSPVSRYLNGQEVIPANAFADFCTVAGLLPKERQRLGRLRDEAAEAAGHGVAQDGEGAAGEAPPESRVPAGPGRWRTFLTGAGDRRRLLAPAAVAAALAAAGVGIATALDDPGGGGRSHLAAPPAESSEPGCTTTRVYRVLEDGDILDGERNDIGDVHADDVFSLDEAPAANPYRFRDYGHVDGAGVKGYVDQAKLKPIGRRCVEKDDGADRTGGAGKDHGGGTRTESGDTSRGTPRSSSPVG